MTEAVTPRKRRWLWRIVALAILGPIITIAALPTLLSTGPARGAFVAMANRSLAPARLEVGGIKLTWLGDTQVSDAVLLDPRGKRVVALPRATLDRGLLDLLSDRTHLGTLTLEGLAIDVERRADGSIDLADLLTRRGKADEGRKAHVEGHHPAPGGFPGVDLELRVVKGSLLVRAPELTEPLKVERFNLDVKTTAAPGPLSLQLRMEKGEGTDGSTLGIDGTYDFRAKAGENVPLALNVLARRWPFGVKAAGVDGRGLVDGQVEVGRKDGRWDLRGDLRLLKLAMSGPALAGDRLRLDLVTAIWDVNNRNAGTWMVRRMNVDSPVVTLSASGQVLGPPGTSAAFDAKVDFAALARQVPHALRLRDGLTLDRGHAVVRLDVRSESDAQDMELGALISDLAAHDADKAIALRSPASLAAKVMRRGTDVRVEEMSVTSEFLQTTGSGDLKEGVKVTGNVDLGAVQSQFRDLINFGGVGMAGQGQFSFEYHRAGTGFASWFLSDFQGLDVRGLTSEPIHREALKLQVSANGACAASGVPTSLGDIKAGIAAGPIGAFAMATFRPDATALTLTATGPLSLAERVEGVARADLKFEGSWGGQALEVGDLRVGLRPANVPAEASPLSLAVRGRYDRARGEVTLNPIPGTARGAIGLTAEGLRVSGLGQPAGALKVDAGLLGDLDALDRTLAALGGSDRYDLAGNWSGRVSVQPTADGRLNLIGRVESPDLSRAGEPGQARKPEGPLIAELRGAYQSEGARLSVDLLSLASRYGSLAARGRLDDLTGRRVADLAGNLGPNWPAINAIVAASIEPGASLQGGGPRAFRVKGPLSGASVAEILKGLDAELGVDLGGAQAYGLKLGPAPMVLRCGGGQALIAPIVTSLNNGKVDLRPQLLLDDPKGIALRLLPGSMMKDVEINDEVSQKVLSYVAPVMKEATQVRGRVSASFERADFPIGGDDSRSMLVRGNIVFNDVVFGSGPLGGELLSLVGKGPDTALRLNQPVQLSIANRRISQSGLEIPISREARIKIHGSVGFDQTLALRADVPITGAMLGNDKTVQNLVAGTSIPVPIGGTLSHPKPDRKALGAALKEVSRSVLKRGAEKEATEFLRRLTRDRGGAAPR